MFRNSVSAFALEELLRGYHRFLCIQDRQEKERKQTAGIGHSREQIWSKLRHNWSKTATNIYNTWHMSDRILRSTTIPFSEAPANFPKLWVQVVATVSYVAARYPHYMTEPTLYNRFLTIAAHNGLKSVPAIFRDCFDHKDLSDRKREEVAAKRWMVSRA